ncbi:MAG: zf-HC2 domain-containing protein [Deltaproteobacteria bacterium]|nr:zf-HC2 domain-containing protein [Deltaproteobacteria bacterium]
MNHADVKNQLADYLEGDLALDARALFDAHLDVCAECADEVDQMQQTVRLLRTLPDPETPPMIAANVMRRIRAGETRLGFFERIGRLLGGVFEPGFMLPASAVAVAALVVMLLQDPSSVLSPTTGSLLGARPSSQASGRSVETRIVAPDARVAGTESRASAPPQAAGAPSSAASAQRSDRMASSPSRIRVEFEPIAPQPPRRLEEPVFAHRVPEPIPLRSPGRVPLTQMHGDPRATTVEGRALPVAQPRAIWSETPIVAEPSSGGEDPRDQWLARGFEDPARFARYLASRSLAEQELWVARLAARAQDQGVLDELVDRLRSSGDSVATVVARDFQAESRRKRALLAEDAMEGAAGEQGGVQLERSR